MKSVAVLMILGSRLSTAFRFFIPVSSGMVSIDNLAPGGRFGTLIDPSHPFCYSSSQYVDDPIPAHWP